MAVIALPPQTVMNIQMFGTVCGQRIINLFQYRAQSAPNPALDYFDYIDSLNVEIIQNQALRDTFLNLMTIEYTLDFIRYQPVFPQRLRFVDKQQQSPGQFGGVTKTANLAASIERFCRTGKRHGIGRIQVVVPDTVMANGVISSAAYQTVMFNMSGLMGLNISAQQPAMVWEPVICNTSAVNPEVHIVQGGTAKNTVRTMHRRTVGLGI